MSEEVDIQAELRPILERHCQAKLTDGELIDTVSGIIEWGIDTDGDHQDGLETIQLYGYDEEESAQIFDVLKRYNDWDPEVDDALDQAVHKEISEEIL